MKKYLLQIVLFFIVFSGVFFFFHGNRKKDLSDSDQSAPSFAALSVQGKTMGTVWSARVFSGDLSWNEDRIRKIIQDTLDHVDRLMSTYKEDSELSRFNQWKSTEWFPVSPEMLFVLDRALEISKKSEGAFDITVGPVVNLWKFGPDKQPLAEIPSEETIQAILRKVGYQKLEIRREDPPAVRKTEPDLYVDLSAIAKGYAVDQATEALKKEKITDFMVEVGGEIRCAGQKSLSPPQKGRSPWILGIEEPRIAGSDRDVVLYRTLPLSDRSLATSGDYRNYRKIGKNRFSHLIDPRTGRPVEFLSENEKEGDKKRLGSVSVVLDSCTDADAWATAFFVLGPERGVEIADKYGIPVLFLRRIGGSEAQKIESIPSKNFSY
ncbi:MAG: FAD:protein FMN transferase [Planctomycetia bacterium]|nr:FAD:protein FMN transferase [Planctomycetia bacterium]